MIQESLGRSGNNKIPDGLVINICTFLSRPLQNWNDQILGFWRTWTATANFSRFLFAFEHYLTDRQSSSLNIFRSFSETVWNMFGNVRTTFGRSSENVDSIRNSWTLVNIYNFYSKVNRTFLQNGRRKFILNWKSIPAPERPSLVWRIPPVIQTSLNFPVFNFRFLDSGRT